MQNDIKRTRKRQLIQHDTAARTFNKCYLKGVLQNETCEQRVIFRVHGAFCCKIRMDPEMTVGEIWDVLEHRSPLLRDQYPEVVTTVDWVFEADGIEYSPTDSVLCKLSSFVGKNGILTTKISDLEVGESGFPTINVCKPVDDIPPPTQTNRPTTSQASPSPHPQKKQRLEKKVEVTDIAPGATKNKDKLLKRIIASHTIGPEFTDTSCLQTETA